MGSANRKKEQDPLISPVMTSLNTNYMINNHGNRNTHQLDIWVKECGFPVTGSFSLRQSETLKSKLTKKKRQEKEIT